MLGLQPEPTVIEAVAYLLYAVPMVLYLVWPDRKRPRPEHRGRSRDEHRRIDCMIAGWSLRPR